MLLCVLLHSSDIFIIFTSYCLWHFPTFSSTFPMLSPKLLRTSTILPSTQETCFIFYPHPLSSSFILSIFCTFSCFWSPTYDLLIYFCFVTSYNSYRSSTVYKQLVVVVRLQSENQLSSPHIYSELTLHPHLIILSPPILRHTYAPTSHSVTHSSLTPYTFVYTIYTTPTITYDVFPKLGHPVLKQGRNT
jgi:hypothetical protein